MKHTVITIAIALLAATAACCSAAKKENKAIVQAEELIAQKKYLSAYQLLDKYDPKNENSDIFLKKVDIVQNYFLFNIMNQIFCLDDIPMDKEIYELRGNEEASGCSSVMFAIDSIALRLLEKEPNNCLLYRCLGDYYTSAADRFGDNWLDNSSELDLRIRARKNYLKAEELGCKDTSLFFEIALTYLYEENYPEARTYLTKAISHSSDTVADYHYNLAVAHIFDEANGDMKQAKTHAAIAARHYKDESLLYDSYFLLGNCYMRTNDYKQALSWFKKADQLKKNMYYNLLNMMVCNLKTGSDDYKTNLQFLLFLYGGNTYSMLEVEDAFLSADSTKSDVLEGILKKQISTSSEPIINANMKLSLGILLYNQNKKTEAREQLLAAKKFFETDENYEEVLSYINDLLKKCK